GYGRLPDAVRQVCARPPQRRSGPRVRFNPGEALLRERADAEHPGSEVAQGERGAAGRGEDCVDLSAGRVVADVVQVIEELQHQLERIEDATEQRNSARAVREA